MAKDPPRIETRRLIMRPLRLDDADRLFAMRNCYEVMKWTSAARVDHTVEQTADWIKMRMDKAKDFFNFALELRDPDASSQSTTSTTSKRIVGVLGAAGFPQVGYMLHPDFWGAGYATEALQAFIPAFWAAIPASRSKAPLPKGQAADARDVLGDHEVDMDAVNDKLDAHLAGTFAGSTNFMEAIIDPQNLGSARVLQKCGFTLWSRTYADFESPFLGTRDTAVYRLARPGTELGTPPRPAGEAEGGSGFA